MTLNLDSKGNEIVHLKFRAFVKDIAYTASSCKSFTLLQQSCNLNNNNILCTMSTSYLCTLQHFPFIQDLHCIDSTRIL